MNNEHSPEPWNVTHDEKGIAISYEDIDVNSATKETPWYIAKVYSIVEGIKDNEGLSNARRIVACVNACAGLSIEALESGVAKDVLMNFASTIIEFELLKEQNRELLDALEKINRCQADGIAPDDPGGWMDFFIETARAAIAKATNQTT